MSQPVIYLASVAGSCKEMLASLGCGGAAELVRLVQSAVGEGYAVEGDVPLIEADVDEARGGRGDDAQRAAAIQRRLGDDRTAAFVALRGGAWLTRILPEIDFAVLDRRRTPIALFGFSELTTLLNIASAHPQAFSLYDWGPAFIREGLKRASAGAGISLTDEELNERFRAELCAFFRDVTAILEGSGSQRAISGRWVSGTLPATTPARFVGGNLAVLTTLLGTPYAAAVDPGGRWLVIEDVNESPDRIDRRLAHLKLAGFFERCAGLLIGDFHEKDADYQAAVTELVGYHLPTGREIPIITTGDVGHVWPLAPLPLNWPIELQAGEQTGEEQKVAFRVRWPVIAPPPGGAS